MEITFNAYTVIKKVWHHCFKRLKRQNGEPSAPYVSSTALPLIALPATALKRADYKHDATRHCAAHLKAALS
jgi:hypothetical protein